MTKAEIVKEVSKSTGIEANTVMAVVEGFMDAIRVSLSGIKNVVALQGTAMTSDQINLLKKLRVKVILCLDNDNAGFYNYAITQENVKRCLIDNPNIIIYAEWLVPHSLRTYRDECWRKFYIFDVVECLGEDNFRYMEYEEYKKGFAISNPFLLNIIIYDC